MRDSAIIRDGVLVLENGTTQPRTPKTKRAARPVSIRFTADMAPIVANLMDIQNPLPTQLQSVLRELTGTATR